MILCFQCEDLSKIFLVFKFEMNRPNFIELINILCHMALSGLKWIINVSNLTALTTML